MKQAYKIKFEGIEFYIDENARLVFFEYLEKIENQFKTYEDYNTKWPAFKQSLQKKIEMQIKSPDKVMTLSILENIINEISNEFDKDTAFNKYEKMYRDTNASVFGGVCAGIAHSLSIDVAIIRLLFIVLVFFTGFGVLAYIILWIALPAYPSANKTSNNPPKMGIDKQKNQTSFIEGFGNFILTVFKSIASLVGLLFLIIGILLLARIFWPHHFPNLFHFPHWDWDWDFNPVLFFNQLNPNKLMFLICILLLILIPVFSIFVGLIRGIFGIKNKSKKFNLALFLLWFMCLLGAVGLFASRSIDSPNFKQTQSINIETSSSSVLYIDMKNINYPDFISDEESDYFFRYRYIHVYGKKIMYGKPVIHIIRSDAPDMNRIVINKSSLSGNAENKYIINSDIEYKWYQQDSMLVFDHYFFTETMEWWTFPSVDIEIIIPKYKDVLFKNPDTKYLFK